MRKLISILILLIVISGYSQEVLRKGKTYTADSTSIVLSEKQFMKMDSLLTDREKLEKENKLLKKRSEISDSLETQLNIQILNLNSQMFLLEQKMELKVEKDTLRQEQLRIKDDIIADLEKDIKKYRGKSGISNNVLWFGTGTVVGALTIYLSSVILSNIGK